MSAKDLVQQTHATRAEFIYRYRSALVRSIAEGQSPEFLFIGCDDSRVIPEKIMGAQPGELFVLRVIANIIPPYGTGERAVGATLEYAVRHLKVEHIIVCGHTDCGGIKALDTRLDQLAEPHLARWIEYARSAQTQVDAQGVEADMRHTAIVEQNVLLQLDNLRSYDVVRRATREESLELHGWVYDLSDGRIRYWDPEAASFVKEAQFAPSGSSIDDPAPSSLLDLPHRDL